MSFWIHATDVVGTFVEKDTGNVFEFSTADQPVFPGFDHRVWVGGVVNDQGYRFARVLKTVAYVVVDEDEFGQPVVERWFIHKRRVFV